MPFSFRSSLGTAVAVLVTGLAAPHAARAQSTVPDANPAPNTPNRPGRGAPAGMVRCSDATTDKAGPAACARHGGMASSVRRPTPATAPRISPSAMSAQTPDSAAAKAGAARASNPGGVAPNGAAPAAAAPNGASLLGPQSGPAKAPATAAQRAPVGGQSVGNDTNPAGATARCKDGTYSHARIQRGACSRHGGVAKRLTS